MDAAEASAGPLAASMTGANLRRRRWPLGRPVGRRPRPPTPWRGAKALLDGQIAERRAVSFAEDAVRAAALRVLAAEELEGLITTAVNARASYIDAVGSLAWLLRNHAEPSADDRARQLVSGADTPPSKWPEAAHADGRMAKRLAALMEGDHP
jgi:hypothetical protein